MEILLSRYCRTLQIFLLNTYLLFRDFFNQSLQSPFLLCSSIAFPPIHLWSFPKASSTIAKESALEFTLLPIQLWILPDNHELKLLCLFLLMIYLIGKLGDIVSSICEWLTYPAKEASIFRFHKSLEAVLSSSMEARS